MRTTSKRDTSHGTCPDRDRSPNRGFTLIELVVYVVILGIFLFLLIPQYNASRSRFALKNAAKSVRSDILRAAGLTKKYSPGTLKTNPIGGNSAAVISPGAPSPIVFSDPLPSGLTITGTPALSSLNAGCTGALAVQFPGGTGLVLSPQAMLLTCAGGISTNATQTISLSDKNGNTAILSIDTRTAAITGP